MYDYLNLWDDCVFVQLPFALSLPHHLSCSFCLFVFSNFVTLFAILYSLVLYFLFWRFFWYLIFHFHEFFMNFLLNFQLGTWITPPLFSAIHASKANFRAVVLFLRPVKNLIIHQSPRIYLNQISFFCFFVIFLRFSLCLLSISYCLNLYVYLDVLYNSYSFNKPMFTEKYSP